MDILFDLIGFLIRALIERKDPNRPPVTRMDRQTPAARGQASARPLAPRTQVAPQDPVYDGEGWRRVLTLLAFIVLFILAAAWIALMQGWL